MDRFNKETVKVRCQWKHPLKRIEAPALELPSEDVGSSAGLRLCDLREQGCRCLGAGVVSGQLGGGDCPTLQCPPPTHPHNF